MISQLSLKAVLGLSASPLSEPGCPLYENDTPVSSTYITAGLDLFCGMQNCCRM